MNAGRLLGGSKKIGALTIIALIIVIGIVIIDRSSALAQTAPPVSHPITGQEKCLTCHSSQGLKPVPENHAAFDEKQCLVCHSTTPVVAVGEDCMTCHGQSNQTMTFADGTVLPLLVENARFNASVHGGKLSCTDCHKDITGFPHPELTVNSAREYAIVQYETCKTCHFDNYTKTLDSVHYRTLAEGDQNAPVCTDCHGAHYVTPSGQPKVSISQTCSKCHESIYQGYASSVHGAALIQDNNGDVPVCTDCHQVHTFPNPTTPAFRFESVTLCSNCHSDASIMDKYGISTKVVKTYLQDFHGASVALESNQSKDIWPDEAVCTDCHGVHNIQSVAPDASGSLVIKENVVTVCQRCHEDANINFPAAWLSHYEPTTTKAPLVFYIRRFYWVMIPFISVGLLAHIMIDFWRRVTNR
jgi:hypothetical protein